LEARADRRAEAMDDVVSLKDLRRELRAVAGELRSRYKQRFRRAGADLIVTAGRAGVVAPGRRIVAVLQLMVEMEVDGFHKVVSFDVAEKTSRLGWRRMESVAVVHRRAIATLDEWIGELEP
jgi:hypothetical protein